MRLVSSTLVSLCFIFLLPFPAFAQPTREQKVRDDRQKVEADGFWHYNDIPRAFGEAKTSGKPIVVVLRCIPCVECVKLDDDLVNQDPKLRPLLEKFVRVRVVSTNVLDLSLFQFDTDQSFAVFLLNADGTIYGRFGTRSHRTNWVGDVSIDGLTKALEGALELHADFAKNKASLAAKKGPAPEFPTPVQYPNLKIKYPDALNYEGKVVESCIHCHQIGDARKVLYRLKGGPLPDDVLFPYPHPKTLGLIFDPKERASLTDVTKSSIAEKAGFRTADAIVSLNGQPLLSIADVQWVLNRTPAEGGAIKALVRRDGKTEEVTLNLGPGWRQVDDLTWRTSTWILRRMAAGAMSLVEIPESERKPGLPTGAVLQVKYVASNGPTALAKNAGFKTGDVILSWDGKTDFRRETDVLTHTMTAHKSGDTVPVTVWRDGKKIDFKLKMQD